jgi:hypothetical protein
MFLHSLDDRSYVRSLFTSQSTVDALTAVFQATALTNPEDLTTLKFLTQHAAEFPPCLSELDSEIGCHQRWLNVWVNTFEKFASSSSPNTLANLLEFGYEQLKELPAPAPSTAVATSADSRPAAPAQTSSSSAAASTSVTPAQVKIEASQGSTAELEVVAETTLHSVLQYIDAEMADVFTAKAGDTSSVQAEQPSDMVELPVLSVHTTNYGAFQRLAAAIEIAIFEKVYDSTSQKLYNKIAVTLDGSQAFDSY